MGEEADADWQAGLGEWGAEDARRWEAEKLAAAKPVLVSCRCGWFGDQDDLITNPYSDIRRCPLCDGHFVRWPKLR